MYLFGLSWVCIASHGLSLVAVSGGASVWCRGRCSEWGRLCLVQGPLIAVVAVACCRAQASGLSGLEACGIEPMFPGLTGGFLTTGPAGKSLLDFFFNFLYWSIAD